MFFLISAHSTATPGVPAVSPLPHFRQPVLLHAPVAFCREFHGRRDPTCLQALTPDYPDNARAPTYYRGCWHVVISLTTTTTHSCGLTMSERGLQPEGFHPSRASLHQAFAHCAIFPTAASRRSLGRIRPNVTVIFAGYLSKPW